MHFEASPPEVKCHHPEVNLPYKYHVATKFGWMNPRPERDSLLGSKVMEDSVGVN